MIVIIIIIIFQQKNLTPPYPTKYKVTLMQCYLFFVQPILHYIFVSLLCIFLFFFVIKLFQGLVFMLDLLETAFRQLNRQLNVIEVYATESLNQEKKNSEFQYASSLQLFSQLIKQESSPFIPPIFQYIYGYNLGNICFTKLKFH